VSAPTPSDTVFVKYNILAGEEVSALNELLSLYGHPDDEDEIAELRLRDDDGHKVKVEIEHIKTLEEDPSTGATHFTGILVGGGDISGHINPGPATTEVVGRATLQIKIAA